MVPRLAWNSPSSCLSLWRAKTAGMCHHAQLGLHSNQHSDLGVFPETLGNIGLLSVFLAPMFDALHCALFLSLKIVLLF